MASALQSTVTPQLTGMWAPEGVHLFRREFVWVAMAVSAFSFLSGAAIADSQDEQDMGYILDGDGFQVETSFSVEADTSHACFRDGSPVDLSKGSWVNSCCLNFADHSRPLEFRQGAIIEVGKGKHRSTIIEADYISDRRFTTGGWEPFHFVKPGLVGYKKHFLSAHELPISNPKIVKSIACFGPAEWTVYVKVGKEEVPGLNALRAQVPIKLMKRHFNGILGYRPDPLRSQPIVIGDARPRSGSKTNGTNPSALAHTPELSRRTLETGKTIP